MTYLKTGDEAPPFEGVDQHGNPVKLTDFKRETLILFFHKSKIKRHTVQILQAPEEK